MADYEQANYSTITTSVEGQGAFPQTVTPMSINSLEEFAVTYPPFILTMAPMGCSPINNIDYDGEGVCMANQFDGEH